MLNIARLKTFLRSALKLLIFLFIFFLFEPHHTAYAAASSKPNPSSSPIASTSSNPVAKKSIVFIGDSYCVGIGASSSEKSFRSILVSKLGVNQVSKCMGGTGYLNRGSGISSCGVKSCLNYLEQIVSVSNAQASRVDVVLISGGKNDLGSGQVFENDIFRKVSYQAISSAKKKFPKAIIVVCSPFWDNTPINPGLFWYEGVLQSQALKAKVKYIPGALTLLQSDDHLLVNANHPNDLGHQIIADYLYENLKSIF